MESQPQIIIIGAGMAGIGASITLTKKKIPHIILEARDRVGGRIYADEFEGVKVEMGASFIHYPKYNNAIHDYVN